ncbi:hypothetical protein JTB14_006157 [Gonioctena quinquepunctata]|nr:hypothetical protein JTB14_006157 [Gonioctena quinquepunctata]
MIQSRRLKLGSLPVWNLGETEYTIEAWIMVPRCKRIHKTHSMLETPSSSTALEMMRCTSPVTECSTIGDSLCATQGSTAPVTKENSPTAGCSRNEALPRTPKTSKAFRRSLMLDKPIGIAIARNNDYLEALGVGNVHVVSETRTISKPKVNPGDPQQTPHTQGLLPLNTVTGKRPVEDISTPTEKITETDKQENTDDPFIKPPEISRAKKPKTKK